MIYFTAIAALLLCVVLWQLLRPLWTETASQSLSPETSQQTLEVLREQRQELDADLGAARIGQAEYDEGVEALARRLVEETGQKNADRQTTTGTWDRRSIATSILVGITALSVLLYAWLGNMNALDPAQRTPVSRITPEQIATMVEKLAQKVADHPDDTEALLMLARSYMVLGRFPDAVLSYEKLDRLRPNDADVLASWADAVANAENGHISEKAEELVERALKLDPENVKALALSGSAAFDRGDYATAITQWERLSTHVDPQSETGKSAHAMIAEAQRRASSESSETPLKVTGTVSLAPALRKNISADDTLFIFARPAKGGAPLAAMRYSAGDLPLHYDFTQAIRMGSADMKNPLVIVARITRAGNTVPTNGDLQGESGSVGQNTQNVDIVIDAIVSDAPGN